jgi:hypothetical protein
LIKRTPPRTHPSRRPETRARRTVEPVQVIRRRAPGEPLMVRLALRVRPIQMSGTVHSRTGFARLARSTHPRRPDLTSRDGFESARWLLILDEYSLESRVPLQMWRPACAHEKGVLATSDRRCGTCGGENTRDGWWVLRVQPGASRRGTADRPGEVPRESGHGRSSPVQHLLARASTVWPNGPAPGPRLLPEPLLLARPDGRRRGTFDR